ncbi:hypothetical protein WJX79_007640 [Trebouxia sp. C0005]
MADPQLFYISKQFANFPSLQSVELSEAEIVQLVAQLCEESERIVHDAGHDAELDKWVQRWTEKAQDFRRQAYGEEPELDSDH